MGCCISTEEASIHEVVFDENGIARRVPKGQGTHLIHVYQDQETNIEKKTRPSLDDHHTPKPQMTPLPRPETAYYPRPPGSKRMTVPKPKTKSKRIHPANLSEKN
ncbi:hypothetical protein [Absidia glauca]|uniref:Uncharacterized protein n=1 Tax=Absidia glauca TaxID=4829 RepID=A0A168PGP2_ABSGL|nr:hypothetical protein [Absidia glauca]